MKKIVTVILEVDTDATDEQIKNDLCTEINCASYYYDVQSIVISQMEENDSLENGLDATAKAMTEFIFDLNPKKVT